MSTKGRSRDTAGRILDAAERLVQTRGFNGFSYADVASELGVTKASLHYHFATKGELGRALIARYHEAFGQLLDAIDRDQVVAADKLARYVALYRHVLNNDRMCLCGMVAAEYATLPKSMQEEIRRFFTANEAWLAGVLDRGVRAGELRLRGGAAIDVSRVLLGGLQGAMLVARAYRSLERFDSAASRLLSDLVDDGVAAAAAKRGRRRRTRAAGARATS